MAIALKCKCFVDLVHINQLDEISNLDEPLLVLGSGSNILFINDYQGTVIHNKILGREILKEDAAHIWLKIGAGENWHDIIMYTLSNYWYGLENLSLIPGTVGAAPVQNIGAYGSDISGFIDHVEAYNLSDKTYTKIENKSCQFGYRESLFKQQNKKFIITYVILKLLKKPKLNLSYKILKDELTAYQNKYNIEVASAHDLSQVVINIRSSKLPDPKLIPNLGSFFKNPHVLNKHLQSLKEIYPALVSYDISGSGSLVKLAAGQLIDLAGFKGKQIGKVAMYQHQALVLTNCGGATGLEIWEYAQCVQKAVWDKFAVNIEPEPLILF